MSTPDGFTDAQGYLVVQARRRFGAVDRETGLRPAGETRLVGLRQSRPEKLGKDQVVVKVTVRLPVKAFDPLTPVALITVPDDLIQRGPIEVLAGDATEEET